MTGSSNDSSGQTPREMGYRFPAEFEPHIATWLSWPHKEASWPGKIHSIYPSYCSFIDELAKNEIVRINVTNESMKSSAIILLQENNTDLRQVEFYYHPTNDAWCRDHGPAFLVNANKQPSKIIVDWNYNAWGNKYPPYELDDVVPTLIGKALDIPVYYPGIIMEGGSVDFNGNGTLITSTCCLLNKNRNPSYDQNQIEKYLMDFYGVNQVLWVEAGIEGDDTDGHIDDTVRFINNDTVIAVVEEKSGHNNYKPLQQNLRDLSRMRLLNGKQLNVVELPMPYQVVYEGQSLPASYANFYIANNIVIVPVFGFDKDEKALQIIQDCFPSRKIVGIDSTDIIWGLGSFHCLSQQEPLC